MSALLLGAFVAIELRSPHPLVRLGILRSSRLVRANIAAMALFGSYIGFQFIGTLYLQSLLGWSSLQTAFAFLPAGLDRRVRIDSHRARHQPLRHAAVAARLRSQC